MEGRVINISRSLIVNNINDSTFMNMMSMYLYIKAISVPSRIFFKNKKDLLRKLHIGSIRFSRIKKHHLFNSFFRVENGFIVAKKHKFNKIQLTFGVSDCTGFKKNRPIIKLDENKIHNIDYICDQIRVALFNNDVIILRNRLYDGEKNTCLLSDDKRYHLPDVLKMGVMSYRTIATKLGCGLTKAKYVVEQAIEQKLVIKKNNIIKLPFHSNPGYAKYLYEEWLNLPENKKVGIAWENNGTFCWQISNSYTTVDPEATNRFYFGYEEIETNKIEFNDVISKEYDIYANQLSEKEKYSFLDFMHMKEVKVQDGTETLISGKEMTSEESIKRSIVRYLKLTYPDWEKLESRRQNNIIRKYFRIYKKENSIKNRIPYYNMLVSCYDRYVAMTEEEKEDAETATRILETACSQAGVTVDAVVSSVYRERKTQAKKGVNITKEQAAKNVFERRMKEGKEKYAKAVLLINDMTSIVLSKRKYQDLLGNGTNFRSIISSNTIEDIVTNSNISIPLPIPNDMN